MTVVNPENNWVVKGERNNKIVALKARGFTVPAIAEYFSLSTAQIESILRDWRQSNPSLRHTDPLEIIDEMLHGYQADMQQLGEIAESTTSGNIAVGAINARMAARDRIIALLQSTGVLPHDLGKLRIELDIRYIAQKIVAVLNAHGVSDEVQADLLAALQAGEIQQIEG